MTEPDDTYPRENYVGDTYTRGKYIGYTEQDDAEQEDFRGSVMETSEGTHVHTSNSEIHTEHTVIPGSVNANHSQVNASTAMDVTSMGATGSVAVSPGANVKTTTRRQTKGKASESRLLPKVAAKNATKVTNATGKAKVAKTNATKSRQSSAVVAASVNTTGSNRRRSKAKVAKAKATKNRQLKEKAVQTRQHERQQS